MPVVLLSLHSSPMFAAQTTWTITSSRASFNRTGYSMVFMFTSYSYLPYLYLSSINSVQLKISSPSLIHRTQSRASRSILQFNIYLQDWTKANLSRCNISFEDIFYRYFSKILCFPKTQFLYNRDEESRTVSITRIQSCSPAALPFLDTHRCKAPNEICWSSFFGDFKKSLSCTKSFTYSHQSSQLSNVQGTKM